MEVKAYSGFLFSCSESDKKSILAFGCSLQEEWEPRYNNYFGGNLVWKYVNVFGCSSTVYLKDKDHVQNDGSVLRWEIAIS